MGGVEGPPPPAGAATRWAAIVAIDIAYLTVTIGESLLAPVFPVAARPLGLSLGQAGFVFSLLAASIAAGNLVGGVLQTRSSPRQGVLLCLAFTAAGGFVTAGSGGAAGFLGGQALLGVGSGMFFPSGIRAMGQLAEPHRRGVAMGLFGVAFSAGLTVAALLVAAQGSSWRAGFAATGALALVAAAVVLFVPFPSRALVPGPSPAPETRPARRPGMKTLLGAPMVLGALGAGAQYGTVSFLPAFAVHDWRLSAGVAALLLAAARALSVAGKIGAGHAVDRAGAAPTVRDISLFLVATGLWWTLVPGAAAAGWAAVLFAAAVGALFPVANLLALEGFRGYGPYLGLFRCVQLGVGAVVSAAIGGLSGVIGLRFTLAATMVLPAALVATAGRLAAHRPTPARTPRPAA